MPASSELTMPCDEVQCAAACKPNLCASSQIARSSETSNDGRSGSLVRVLPAGRGSLDEVRAFLDELAHSGAALVHARRGRAEIAEMPADDGDRSAREYQARRGDDAHLDRLPQQECRAVFRAAVSQRGYAGIQVFARVLRRLNRQHFVGQ